MNINTIYKNPFNNHLLIAYWNWLEENGERCEILVDADLLGDDLPFLTKYFSPQNTLILNISSGATRDLVITSTKLSFAAKINGIRYHIEIPTAAVMGIFINTHNNERVLLPFIPMAESMNISIPKSKTTVNHDNIDDTMDDVVTTPTAQVFEFKRPQK